jgi:hypothetical protein
MTNVRPAKMKIHQARMTFDYWLVLVISAYFSKDGARPGHGHGCNSSGAWRARRYTLVAYQSMST